MKHILTLTLLALMGLSATAQQYKISFTLKGETDSVLYLAQHYLDGVRIIDSARLEKGSYTFKGRHKFARGIYCLVGQDRSTPCGDFAIDDSQKFCIEADSMLVAETAKVKGSLVNKQMFEYQAVEDEARRAMERIRELKAKPETKAQAEADERALGERMTAFEESARYPKNPNIYFELANACENPVVPDTVADKLHYYRTHYWDHLFSKEWVEFANTKDNPLHSALLHSPQLFSKMNYFFYGLLYYADSDTIIAELDRLMARIDGDTALMKYVLEFITPKYFRSTKNIGWDAVWCHIAGEYYLKGRCPWTSEGTLHNTRYNYDRIKQSIIGAHGQELWMADTNQSNDPADWISSHRFPTKYVILWFWDPDCHHCQEQSEELKKMYDDMVAKGEKRFEVYAVGYESDVAKWKKYVKEHQFNWVNVGGTNVNIDYQEAYNVHGAPTMIILNEKRDIIMNKVLPVKSLMRFLDEYEKRSK